MLHSRDERIEGHRQAYAGTGTHELTVAHEGPMLEQKSQVRMKKQQTESVTRSCSSGILTKGTACNLWQ